MSGKSSSQETPLKEEAQPTLTELEKAPLETLLDMLTAFRDHKNMPVKSKADIAAIKASQESLRERYPVFSTMPELSFVDRMNLLLELIEGKMQKHIEALPTLESLHSFLTTFAQTVNGIKHCSFHLKPRILRDTLAIIKRILDNPEMSSEKIANVCKGIPTIYGLRDTVRVLATKEDIKGTVDTALTASPPVSEASRLNGAPFTKFFQETLNALPYKKLLETVTALKKYRVSISDLADHTTEETARATANTTIEKTEKDSPYLKAYRSSPKHLREITNMAVSLAESKIKSEVRNCSSVESLLALLQTVQNEGVPQIKKAVLEKSMTTIEKIIEGEGGEKLSRKVKKAILRTHGIRDKVITLVKEGKIREKAETVSSATPQEVADRVKDEVKTTLATASTAVDETPPATSSTPPAETSVTQA